MHKAEQIIVVVLAGLTGLTTTGANVRRGNVHKWPENTQYALAIMMGADVKVDEKSYGLADWMLTINVEAYVKTSSDQVDTKLNLIRSEVVVKLMTDIKQGLDFVENTIEGDIDDPELSGDGDKPGGRLIMPWHFKYRRSIFNPDV